MQLKFKNYKKYYGKICKKENDKNIIQKEQKLYYCYKCLNFYCLNKGKNIYAKKDRHKIIFNNSYDNICFEHKENNIVGYSEYHNKNYCMKGNDFAENNKKIEEELNEDKIKKNEKEMNKNRKIKKNRNFI